MSTSSPVRNRQPRRPSRPPQERSERPPRDATAVARSILMVVAAVSVLATSNYFAYLIGRKQVTYEELRRQVDLVVQFMDQKRIEKGLTSTAVKQRQDRLQQNAPGLTGLTTSTINGKTTAVAPGPAPAERAMPAALIDDTAVARPDNELRAQAPEPSPDAAAKHRDLQRAAHQRGPRRQKAPRRDPTEAMAQQPGQLTNAPSAAPDAGAAGQ
jgi:hypothetical protein